MNRKRSKTVHLALLVTTAVLLFVLTPAMVTATDRCTGERVVIEASETINDNVISSGCTDGMKVEEQ